MTCRDFFALEGSETFGVFGRVWQGGIDGVGFKLAVGLAVRLALKDRLNGWMGWMARLGWLGWAGLTGIG